MKLEQRYNNSIDMTMPSSNTHAATTQKQFKECSGVSYGLFKPSMNQTVRYSMESDDDQLDGFTASWHKESKNSAIVVTDRKRRNIQVIRRDNVLMQNQHHRMDSEHDGEQAELSFLSSAHPRRGWGRTKGPKSTRNKGKGNSVVVSQDAVQLTQLLNSQQLKLDMDLINSRINNAILRSKNQQASLRSMERSVT